MGSESTDLGGFAVPGRPGEWAALWGPLHGNFGKMDSESTDLGGSAVPGGQEKGQLFGDRCREIFGKWVPGGEEGADFGEPLHLIVNQNTALTINLPPNETKSVSG
jgi:hypothetical protein